MDSVALNLDGRAALVTGASRGLGRAIAISLACAGANVALVARSSAGLEEVAEEIRGMGRIALVAAGDLTCSAEVDEGLRKVFEEFGRLDILVHSAGNNLRKPVFEISDREWHSVIDANLTSTFYVCRSAARLMSHAGGGSIVNIASSAGLRGRPNNAPYSAAKAGVINMSRAFAVEWAPQGIRVNVLAPGRFFTSLTEKEMSDPEKYASFVKGVPLRRIGKPEELREIVVWLASDASSFVTGSLIVIDGGQTLL